VKITKKILKVLIKEEAANYFPPISMPYDPNKTIDTFNQTAFADKSAMIKQILKRIEHIVREDEGMERKDLLYFRDHELGEVETAIDYLKDVIDLKLDDKV
jgi:predicted nuclease of restriction endonuclease-like RecB superfamily